MYFKFTTNPNRSYLLFPLSSQTQGLQAFYIVLQDWYTMLYTPEGCYTISFVSFHILSSKSLIMREFLISELLWLQWLCFLTRSEVAVQMPKGTDSLQESLVQCVPSLHLLVGHCLYSCSSKSFRAQDQERWEDTWIKGTTGWLPLWGYRLNSTKEKRVLLSISPLRDS